VGDLLRRTADRCLSPKEYRAHAVPGFPLFARVARRKAIDWDLRLVASLIPPVVVLAER
jgi:hypothetical protein